MEAQRKKAGRKRKPFTLALDPLHDRTINLCCWALILFGTAMIISTSLGQTTSNANAVSSTAVKQLVFIIAAYICMWWMDKYMRLSTLQMLQIPASILFFAMMCATFAFPAVGGSRAWIYFSGMTLQPSEFGKPLLIILCACSLFKARQNPGMRTSLKALFKLPIFMAVLTLGLLVAQKDFGTLVITLGIFLVCILLPTGKGYTPGQRRIFLIVMAVGLIGFLLVFTNLGTWLLSRFSFTYHIAQRIENMKNPYTDVYNSGYQPANSLYGIADAGIFGRGYGNSMRKYGYLTQADNDYILAVIIEETGIFGLGFILVCYFLLVSHLIRYALRTNNMAYKTILTGTAAYLMLHFIINVGGVGAAIPMTGVPLLFISSGGSSLMAVCIAIGACQHCIQQIRRQETKGAVHES